MALPLERAVPNLARLPSEPPAGARSIHCDHCTNWLGQVANGLIWTRHKGRRQVAHLPARVTCERCGRVKTLPPPA